MSPALRRFVIRGEPVDSIGLKEARAARRRRLPRVWICLVIATRAARSLGQERAPIQEPDITYFGAVPEGCWSTASPAAGSTVPLGWVLCDGMEYDGTLPEFAALYDAIGTSFGAGRDANLFKVPDLRGQLLRGRDGGAGNDPDAAQRSGGDAVG